jgi:hypothetical protein
VSLHKFIIIEVFARKLAAMISSTRLSCYWCILINLYTLNNLVELIIPFYCSNTGVFVSNEAYDYANSNLYNSFHFAHMLILFIGLTFILQAILIIVLVASRKVNIIN